MKKETKINIYKVLGVVITLFGLFWFTAYHLYGTMAVTWIYTISQNMELAEAIVTALRNAIIASIAFYGTFLVFELVNYVLYLKKHSKILIYSIILEIIIGLVLVKSNGTFLDLRYYALLIPAVTGLINLRLIYLGNKK